MARSMTPEVHPDALELADLLRHYWPSISAGIRTSGAPVCEGDPDLTTDPAQDPDPQDLPAADGEPDPDPITADDDWRTKARKHERDLKRERKERERLEAELQQRQDADKSEQEKALEEARREAREEALSEAEKERRADRLEVAVTRLATRGVQAGEDTVKFADPEDVLTLVERQIARGDLDADDIFDDHGKVQPDALAEALAEIAAAKPHWIAHDTPARPNGSADGGRGDGPGKSLEEMSVEDHAKRKYGRA